MAIAISGIFSAWLVLTVAVQFPAFPLRKTRYLGVLGNLIPAWHFFAPRPPQGDYEVWYRTVTQFEGVLRVTEWRMLDGCGPRQPTQLFVYPSRRSKHALQACCTRIVKATRRGVSNQLKVMISAPYLLLLAHIAAQANSGEDIQFRIDFVSSRPDRSRPQGRSASTTLFQSPIHQGRKPSTGRNR